MPNNEEHPLCDSRCNCGRGFTAKHVPHQVLVLGSLAVGLSRWVLWCTWDLGHFLTQLMTDTAPENNGTWNRTLAQCDVCGLEASCPQFKDLCLKDLQSELTELEQIPNLPVQDRAASYSHHHPGDCCPCFYNGQGTRTTNGSGHLGTLFLHFVLTFCETSKWQADFFSLNTADSLNRKANP